MVFRKWAMDRGSRVGVISEELEVLVACNSLGKHPRGGLRHGKRVQGKVWVDVGEAGALVQGKGLRILHRGEAEIEHTLG